MPFTTNMTGTAQIDDSIVKEYDAQFIVASHEGLIADQFVTEKKMIGAKSIEFPKYNVLSVSTTALTENEDVVSAAMADTQVILTPAEYGAVVTTTKLANLQSGGKADLAAARLVGINMAQTLTRLFVLAGEATTNVLTVDGGAENALDSSDVCTPTFLNKLYNKLQKANVMPFDAEGYYVFMAHDDVIHDLRNQTSAGGWQDINKYARPETVLKNEIGQLCGFRIVRNNLCSPKVDAGSTGTDTYHCLAFGYNAIGKAVSAEPSLRITGPFDKLGRFVNIGWHACLQYKIVDTDAIWKGICASSVGNNATG